MPSQISLSPARYALKRFHLGVHSSLYPDFPELEGKLEAFGCFVGQRLTERQAWPASHTALQVYLTEEADDRDWPEIEKQDWVGVKAPSLGGEETDEELIFKVATACEAAVAHLLPGIQLSVLADEFIAAGCVCLMKPPSVSARGVTARVEVRLSMRDFVADLEVETSGGVTRYRVLQGAPGSTWDVILGRLSVSAKQVVIRALPGGVYIRRTGKRSYGFITGDSLSARRFVIELGRGGTKRVAQEWEFTAKGGRPLRGTRLLAANATMKAFDRDFRRDQKRRASKRAGR